MLAGKLFPNSEGSENRWAGEWAEGQVTAALMKEVTTVEQMNEEVWW